MKIQLSDHFTFRRLLLFTLPSILMMVFTSIYSVVDGFFVSNFVGKTPFAAVNFIMPFLMILGSLGAMFGTGGSALISKALGEGKPEKAKQLFSFLIYISAAIGVIVAVLGILFIRPIAALLGAEGAMLDDCVLYGRIILTTLPAYILQYEFQSLFITAEKPHLGLGVTIAAGLTNIVLDALFVAVFQWGLAGAAIATAASQTIGGIIPLFYFGRKNKSLLKLTKTHFDIRALVKTCTNGSSELMSTVSTSIVSMLYNIQLMRYAVLEGFNPEDGVAAYGVMMYVGYIFLAIFLGYSFGTAPIIGYNYGSQNHMELKNLFKKSLIIISIFSISMFIAAEILATPLSNIFVGYDENLLNLTLKGFMIFSFQFLFCGIGIFGSSFFTALNNGLISAIIAFLRTLVFQIAAILIFPIFLGTNGIWLSVAVAEFLAAIVSIVFLIIMKKKYHY